MADRIRPGAGTGDDAGMPIPKAVRWVLWALWWGCLAFSLWFFWELYVLYTSDT